MAGDAAAADTACGSGARLLARTLSRGRNAASGQGGCSGSGQLSGLSLQPRGSAALLQALPRSTRFASQPVAFLGDFALGNQDATVTGSAVVVTLCPACSSQAVWAAVRPALALGCKCMRAAGRGTVSSLLLLQKFSVPCPRRGLSEGVELGSPLPGHSQPCRRKREAPPWPGWARRAGAEARVLPAWPCPASRGPSRRGETGPARASLAQMQTCVKGLPSPSRRRKRPPCPRHPDGSFGPDRAIKSQKLQNNLFVPCGTHTAERAIDGCGARGARALLPSRPSKAHLFRVV